MSQSPIPLSVIAGFLGAGKTTLLNHLLANAGGMRFAVLVNDFGAINVDAGLVRSADAQKIALANGCVCCSIGGDLMAALLRLAAQPQRPEHVLVEASGVSDPLRIAQVGLAGRAYSLEGVLVLADAEQVRARAQDLHVGETVLRQLAAADLLLLNKTDLVPPPALAGVRAWLADVAPRARVVETVHARVPVALALGPGRTNGPFLAAGPAPRRAVPQGADHAGFEAAVLPCPEPVDRARLERLLSGLPEGILRLKGVVRLGASPPGWWLVQAVGPRWRLTPWAGPASGPPEPGLVVIGIPGQVEPERLGAALFGHERVEDAKTTQRQEAP